MTREMRRNRRHWIVCQALIDPATQLLTDGISFWGGTTLWNGDQLYPFAAVYILNDTLGALNPTVKVGTAVVEELECQFFGVPNTQPVSINQNDTQIITQVSPGVTSVPIVPFAATGAITFGAGLSVGALVPSAHATTNFNNWVTNDLNPRVMVSTLGTPGVVQQADTTVPSYGIVGAAVPVPIPTAFAGGTTAFSATTVGLNFQSTGLNFGVGASSFFTTVELQLYISEYDDATGTWSLIDMSEINGQSYDFLDHQEDAVLMPIGFYGYSSRSWRLRLPYPVTLSNRQALICQITQGQGTGFLNLFANIRSRVSVIA